MKRWAFADMLAVGRTLFAKIHKQKRFANPNNDVHFMAREMDDWLVKGIQTLMDGTYTPRFLKRYYFKDEMVDQLHLSDRILQHIILKQLKPTFAHVMHPRCYHLQGPSGVKVATQHIRKVLEEEKPQYVIRADIKSFYKSISHHQLIQDINSLYDDLKVQAILKEIIINPIETPRGYKNADHGIALRGPLSQFFSGIYLKPLDEAFDGMNVTYLRYQDDIVIFCQTARQLERCKQRMNAVLKERRLQLSRKKTRIGSIEKGFHFLGINYPGTQTLDNTTVPQANKKSVNTPELSKINPRWGGVRQLNTYCLSQLALFRIHGHCVRRANKSIKWSPLGFLPAGSAITCIVGARGGRGHQNVGIIRNCWDGFLLRAGHQILPRALRQDYCTRLKLHSLYTQIIFQILNRGMQSLYKRRQVDFSPRFI